MNKNNDNTSTKNSTIFSQMKISMRIGLSFAVILIIFIVTSIFNLNIFSQHESSFSYYAKVNSDTIKIFEIDRQVSELQRIILIYSNTGSNGIIRRAKNTHQTLINSLDEIKNSIGEQENLSIGNNTSLTLLNSMKKELEDYGENINILAESREQRDLLIDESMQSLANDSLKIITELKNTAQKEDKKDLIKNIYSISDRLLTAQVNAVSFFANRQYKLKNKANKSLKQAKENTIKLHNHKESSDELKKLTKKLIDNISAYEQVFHQTLQATRDYLSLINVVMAGEATEFTTQSKNLKNSTLSTLEKLTELTNKQLHSAQKITYFVTAIAITIGFALAFLTSQSLSRPIREIAGTFEQLVNGNHNTKIPGLDRGDEIGQLANAANVFKTMNERTEKILEESQILAGELQVREKQLETQTAALQKSNDELDNFAYIASHDLKSPLRAIDNLSKWVKEDCEDILPEESREHLTKMQERIVRMEGLLSDLLNYSRVGRVDVVVEKVNVAVLVENAVEVINKPENVMITISQNLPEITTQVSPLQQVFLNLLTNAIKYTDKDEITIDVNSQILNKEFVEFSVSDNGPGIDPKFHERIFQMFQTLQSRDVIDSSGMGLAIIKKVVEGQGGEIRVNSALGEGSVFTFSWPVNNTNNNEAIS